MKLFALLIFLCSSAAVWGQGFGQSVAFQAAAAKRPAAGGGGGACATARDSETRSYADTVYAADPAYGYATKFTNTTTTTICKITFPMWKASGTLNGTITASIYTDASNKPGTLVGSSSDTVNASTVTATTAGTAQTITFTGLSASVTSGTVYRVVFLRSAGATGEIGVNYLTVTGCDIDLNDSGSWSDYLANSRLLFETFSE